MKALLFLLLCSTSIFSQTKNDSIAIQGHLKNNTRHAKIVVKKFDVGSFDIAAAAINNEKFKLMAPANIPPGVYRLQYSQLNAAEYIDIIINGTEKNISFTLDVLKEGSLPIFTASEENKKWYTYIEESNKKLQKIETLKHVLTFYPTKTDKIITQVKKAIAKEITIYNKAFTHFTKENKNTWAGNMVQNNPYYFTTQTADVSQENLEHHNNFWNNINTNNPALINTPLYTEHILNYLRYYLNPDIKYNQEEINNGLLESVTTIMQKFSGTEETENFALKYLQLGFKEIGKEKVLQYLDQKYAAIITKNNSTKAENADFETRMAGYEALKVGNAAPNSTLHTADKQVNKIYDVVNDKVILAFWASWCPTCEAQMPLVENYAKNNTNVSIIAISLDDNKTAYANAIKKLPSMLHSSDFKKWQSKAVNDYYIYGSPTFIVLDKNHKILGKYTSWELAEKTL